MNIITDEVEKTEEYLAIKDEVDKEIEKLIKKNQLGQCHELWEFKKSLLKNKYNINWRTPEELNPNIVFD